MLPHERSYKESHHAEGNIELWAADALNDVHPRDRDLKLRKHIREQIDRKRLENFWNTRVYDLRSDSLNRGTRSPTKREGRRTTGVSARIRFPWSALSVYCCRCCRCCCCYRHRLADITEHVHCLRHFVSTFYSSTLSPGMLRGNVREEKRGCIGITNGKRSCLSDVFHIGRTKLLLSTSELNYRTPNTWLGICPLEMHVRQNRETLLSTWFVLRFQLELSRETRYLFFS